MISIKSDDLWQELNKAAEQTKNIKAAVAYVSDDSVIKFKSGDLLIVDASAASISGGRTSAEVIKVAFNDGAKLYSCDTLHGKVIVFDHIAYLGSANISNSSIDHLDEVGILSNHPSIMSGAIQFIEELIKKSIIIDDAFIKRILEIEVKRGKPKRGAKRAIKIEKPNTWLVSVIINIDYPGDETIVERDSESIETLKSETSGYFWIEKRYKHLHSMYNTAKIGDSLILMERTEDDSETAETVYRHCPIKAITIDEEYEIKTYHYTYKEDTNAYPVKWPRFKEIAKQAGIYHLGKGKTICKILPEKQSNTLFELWDPMAL